MTAPQIEWQNVRKVLIVRLRSIGDTVLATPCLDALRRFLPDAQIDILLEDWVAPVLDGFDAVDNVLTVKKGDTRDRLRVLYQLSKRGYDVAFNLHGGTTAGFFTAATRAKYRVGFASYQYQFLYNVLAPPANEFWRQEKSHSAEQQLALLGINGVPVDDKPKSRLVVKPELQNITAEIFEKYDIPPGYEFALVHPAAAFETKRWSTDNFAEIVQRLYDQGIISIAVGTKNDLEVLLELFDKSPLQIILHDKTLPEIAALAAQAKIFIGNDSGIAHVAAAVGTPSVVIFGSSNVAHWRPWTNAPHEIVTENLDCAPCAGYNCEKFEQPECISRVSADKVKAAIDRVLLQDSR